MLYDNLEGWDGVGGLEGRFKREGTYVYLWLIHVVWQKPTPHCKAIALQLKKNFFKVVATSSKIHYPQYVSLLCYSRTSL